MQNILADFCARCTVPAEGAASLEENLTALMSSPAWPEFEALLADYENDPAFVWSGALAGVDALAAKAGVHTYVLQFLYSVLLLPAAKRRWLTKGLSEQLFWASMADLKIKLDECYKLHGIWGTFVAGWFGRWFDATRVWLGRLQFEAVRFGDVSSEPLILAGCTVHSEDWLINVHMPSGSHMPREAVLDAYRQAVAFFAPGGAGAAIADTDRICRTAFGGPIFCCHSWLLWPALEEFLPAHSNVLAFLRDYTIVEARETDGGDLWRTFYVEYKGDAAVLPETGSFNRAYKSWLLAGGKCGVGMGVLLWDAQANAPRPRQKL